MGYLYVCNVGSGGDGTTRVGCVSLACITVMVAVSKQVGTVCVVI